MKNLGLVLFILSLSPAILAQTLPDEINHAPYRTRFEQVRGQRDDVNNQLSGANLSLGQTRQTISVLQNSIARSEADNNQLRRQIAENQSTLPRLRNEVTSLQNSIGQETNSLQNTQRQVDQVRSRRSNEQARIRPLEQRVQNAQSRIAQAETEARNFRQEERQAQSQIDRLNTTVANLERQINEEKQKQQTLRSAQSASQAELQRLQSTLSSQQSQIATKEGEKTREEAKLRQLNSSVSDAQAELDRLRAAAAPATEIASAERLLRAITAKREDQVNVVNNLANEIRGLNSQISQTSSAIDRLSREISSYPTEISRSEQRERELTNLRNSSSQELIAANRTLTQSRTQAEARESQVAQLRRDIQQDEAELRNARQTIDGFDREITQLERNISIYEQNIQSARSRISSLDSQIRQLESEIPNLQNQVRNNENSINRQNQDLASYQNQERTILSDISRLESQLSQLRSQTDQAEREYQQRLSLYERYLGEARSLGSSQTNPSIALGEAEGKKISDRISANLGATSGKDLGAGEAKLWGQVRGEIQGYDKGWNEGIISADDIQRGNREGIAAGKAAAETYAQQNLKPQFFVNYFTEALKEDLDKSNIELWEDKNLDRVSFKMAAAKHLTNAEKAVIADLTAAELRRSQELATSLDSAITSSQSEVRTLTTRGADLKNPANSFEHPTQIPYGTADCSQVYKNVTAYRDACASSYRTSFAQRFDSAAYTSFAQVHPAKFETSFEASRVNERDTRFNAHFTPAHTTAHGEALALGKQHIYQTRFTASRDAAYASELPLATERAKVTADNEVKAWIRTNSTVTVSKTKVGQTRLRGGDQIKLHVTLKNISPVVSNSPITIKVNRLQNAAMATTTTVVRQVPARQEILSDALSFQVSATARSGEKVILEGEATLPGDKYRASRTETFKVEAALSANPKMESILNFDDSPDIRNLLGTVYYVHTIKVSVKPSVEALSDGYEIKLKGVGANANLIALKQIHAATGALSRGQQSDHEFKYTLHKDAKNKTVQVEVSYLYLGEVLKTEVIDLKAH